MSARFIPLHRLLKADRPDELTVCHDGERFINWTEFSSRTVALAGALAAMPQQRWLLSHDNACEFAIWFLALLHAEKRIVLPPNTQPGTLALLQHAFDAVAGDIPLPKAAAFEIGTFDPNLAGIDLYTSGSTGMPKCINKTLRQLECEVATLETVWGDALQDATMLATVPHHHIYGLLFRLLWPLCTGRTFDAVISTHPDILQQRAALLGPHALIASPAHLSRLPELLSASAWHPAPTLVFSSGGPLLPAAAQHFSHHFGHAPTEVFGSTETGGIAWRCQDQGEWWTPFPDIEVSNDDNQAAWLRSPLLTSHDAWPLDDILEFADDGKFRLCGRRDRVVKIEGKRISLTDIEARLREHAWVENAAAIALTQQRQSIGAVIVLNERGRQVQREGGRSLLNREFRHHLAHFYEPVLQPRHWRYPDQLPFNAQGKTTQVALMELFAMANDEPATA